MSNRMRRTSSVGSETGGGVTERQYRRKKKRRESKQRERQQAQPEQVQQDPQQHQQQHQEVEQQQWASPVVSVERVRKKGRLKKEKRQVLDTHLLESPPHGQSSEVAVVISPYRPVVPFVVEDDDDGEEDDGMYDDDDEDDLQVRDWNKSDPSSAAEEQEEEDAEEHEQQRKMFSWWRCLVQQGFNLLVSGVGCKRELLMEFTRCFPYAHICVVDGSDAGLQMLELARLMARTMGMEYSPRDSVFDIVGALEETLREFRGAPSEEEDEASSGALDDDVAVSFRGDVSFRDLAPEGPSHCPVPLSVSWLLVVHDLDGASLGAAFPARRGLLERLAELPEVSLVASANHINLGLLWDRQQFEGAHWIHVVRDTFLPMPQFVIDNRWEDSLAINMGLEQGVQQMLKGLPALAVKAYAFLCDPEAKRGGYLTVQQWAKEGGFSAKNVRHWTIELLDHNAIKEKTVAGVQSYRVTLSEPARKRIMTWIAERTKKK